MSKHRMPPIKREIASALGNRLRAEWHQAETGHCQGELVHGPMDRHTDIIMGIQSLPATFPL